MSDPNPNVPSIPNHLQARTVSDMWPDEIIFPYNGGLTIDSTSDHLFVNKRSTLDDDDHNPSYFGNRVGLMRLYSLDEAGKLHDGFVADLRAAKRGSIYNQMITANEDSDELSKKSVTDLAAKKEFEPLLAAVYLNEDGNEQIMGDESVFSAVEFLKNAADALKNKPSTDQVDSEDKKAKTMDKNTEIVEQPSLFGE